ncbi:MAG: acetylxylan esterase [Planctomycetota bacterium]|nr:acetylxylan esterase [Planctomycetota bacterium]
MQHNGWLAAAIVYTMTGIAWAQPKDTIYDEAQVPAYTLPDPLTMQDGTRVTDPDTWRSKRRPEILGLFQSHVYGRTPTAIPKIVFEITSLDANALGGKATRKEVAIFLLGKRDGPRMDLLLYVPNGADKPVPTFIGLNFYGNHCIHPDPGITLSKTWMRPTREMGVVDNHSTEASRGCQASRWQVEKVLDRGYGLATVYYGDIEPDFPEGWKLGLRAALSPQGKDTVFQPDDWGAIGGWACGLSRAMDYLEQEPAVDAKRVAVMGHSRLGKTALWAGAQDERFAIVISNNSGEGGASLVRRRFGEAIHHSVSMVPYWYCTRYRQYAWHEADLPVDAHMLVSLMAPRPVYVASASKDLWADPRGEFLAAKHAEPVYQLLGRAGLGVADMPSADHPVGDFIGYHVRTGDHDVTAYDWEQYLAFADRHFRKGVGGGTEQQREDGTKSP